MDRRTDKSLRACMRAPTHPSPRAHPIYTHMHTSTRTRARKRAHAPTHMHACARARTGTSTPTDTQNTATTYLPTLPRHPPMMQPLWLQARNTYMGKTMRISQEFSSATLHADQAIRADYESAFVGLVAGAISSCTPEEIVFSLYIYIHILER